MPGSSSATYPILTATRYDFSAAGACSSSPTERPETDGPRLKSILKTYRADTAWPAAGGHARAIDCDGLPGQWLVGNGVFLQLVRRKAWENNVKSFDRKFIYEGWNLVAEIDAVSGKVVRSYAWGLDTASSLTATDGVGALVLQTVHTDTTLTSYHVASDAGGNVAALVKRNPGQAADGAVAAVYEYGPFGEVVRAQAFDPNLTYQPFRFSTKYTDAETGLLYYGLRYYDPSQGRFINRDPIGEAGGVNLYGFVGNGPVNRIDVLGLQDVTHPNERPPEDYFPPPASSRVYIPIITFGGPSYEPAIKDATNRGLEENRRGLDSETRGLPERSIWDIFADGGYRAPSGGYVNTPWGQMQIPTSQISPEVWQGQAQAMLRDAITIAKFEAEVVISIAGPEIAIAWVVRGVRYVVMVRRMAEAERLAAEIRAGSLARYGPGEGIVAMAGATSANARALARAMEAAGQVRQAGQAAHHIVAGTHPGAAGARAVLQKFGIGVNEAANGVFLGAEHASIHTGRYFAAVERELGAATTREQAIAILKSISERISSGAFPR